MTNHQKGSTTTIIATVLLLLTVIIRHTSSDPMAQRWANDFIPPVAFILLVIGIRFTARARKDTQSVPRE